MQIQTQLSLISHIIIFSSTTPYFYSWVNLTRSCMYLLLVSELHRSYELNTFLASLMRNQELVDGNRMLRIKGVKIFIRMSSISPPARKVPLFRLFMCSLWGLCNFSFRRRRSRGWSRRWWSWAPGWRTWSATRAGSPSGSPSGRVLSSPRSACCTWSRRRPLWSPSCFSWIAVNILVDHDLLIWWRFEGTQQIHILVLTIGQGVINGESLFHQSNIFLRILQRNKVPIDIRVNELQILKSILPSNQ